MCLEQPAARRSMMQLLERSEIRLIFREYAMYHATYSFSMLYRYTRTIKGILLLLLLLLLLLRLLLPLPNIRPPHELRLSYLYPSEALDRYGAENGPSQSPNP